MICLCVAASPSIPGCPFLNVLCAPAIRASLDFRDFPSEIFAVANARSLVNTGWVSMNVKKG